MTARHASGELSLGGIDILASLSSQNVIAFSYEDHTDDQGDSLIVEIADPSRSWMKDFLPKKGSECTAKIKVYNWTTPGDSRTLDCGSFWLDEINYAGPPNVVAVKATSIPPDGIKGEQNNFGWENSSLRQVAEEKAAKHGLSVVWATKKAPPVEQRIDQNETPDLEFLRDRAKDQGLNVKLFNKQLIFYSEEEYEAQPGVFTITYGASSILSFAFASRLHDTYQRAEVSDVNPDTGNHIEGEFEDKDPASTKKGTTRHQERIEDDSEGGEGNGGDGGEGRAGYPPYGVEIDLDSDPASTARANEKAKHKLRAKNKREKTATFRMFGNPDYLSGLNAELVGFGIFDGKWFIESTVHEIGSNGYQTELKLHFALGY
jgi:Bacteriophage probable baseplate hub protein